ncbi:MAG TPA: hypothetical protein VKO45_01210 [Methanomicrobiales archaeon]|nr:hypothetical protein [Methanomicrobiales archaeon]
MNRGLSAGGILAVLWILVLLTGCLQGGHSGDMGSPSFTTPEATQVTVETSPSPVTGGEPLTPVPVPPPASDAVWRSFSFASGAHNYSFRIPVAPAEADDTGTSSCPLLSWRPGDESRLASYYSGIFKDPGEDPLYDSLLGELQRIRRTERLNSDEYLELMVHFVQQIPYDPAAPVCPRRPGRLILDGKGDCDERSLLLLGMLYREGFDAAILIFPAKHHATAGIRIDVATQPSFRVFDLRGRKYVYIETTRPSFIGLYPEEFESEDPVIVPTGTGSTTYRAINDVMHIVSTQRRMEDRMRWINETGTGMLTEIQALEEKLTAGTGYSTQEEFDQDYVRYNSLVTQFNGYVEDFGRIRDVYLFVLDHQVDRLGVAGRIANSKVENLL